MVAGRAHSILFLVENDVISSLDMGWVNFLYVNFLSLYCLDLTIFSIRPCSFHFSSFDFRKPLFFYRNLVTWVCYFIFLKPCTLIYFYEAVSLCNAIEWCLFLLYSDEVSLNGLQLELEECKDDNVRKYWCF